MKVRLFYLGGQSNMDGYGFTEDLPNYLNKEFKDVYIFHGNPAPDKTINGGKGFWKRLTPGHGVDFSSTNKSCKLSNRFGVELSFAQKIKKYYPKDIILIVKYSKSGTSIDGKAAREFGSWDTNLILKKRINQYNHCLKTIENALHSANFSKNFKKEEIIFSGILWMQGESDSLEKDIAEKYYKNLKRLMKLIRVAFKTDNLPIVLGKISDSLHNKKDKVWAYGDIVQSAQEKFVRKDKNSAIVRDTKHYKYSDLYHYNSSGYIDLGERFADTLYKLIKS